MKKLIVISFISLLPFIGYTQNFGLGVSAMYNFQTESVGFGLRGNIYPNKTISYVPQISYYPGIGPISELTIGCGVEYKFYKIRSFTFYSLAHAGYNRWMNPNPTVMENAKPNNWNLEAGLGVTTNKCLRPFLEYRYNIKFMETHLQLGLLYIFGCKGGKKKGGGRGKFKSSIGGRYCPAYD